jgi:apolipoprotein N-acyltransferase
MISPLVASALSGVLFSFSFAPARLDLLAWIGLVPFFWALSRSSTRAHAALLGFGFGFTFSLLDVSWVYRTLLIHGHFAPLPAVLTLLGMVATLALFPVGFACALDMIGGRGYGPAIVAPFLWVLFEYLRTVVLTGFPWDLAAYSQADRLVVAQVADITGVYGISFLVVLVNATVWEACERLTARRGLKWSMIATTACALILVLGYGWVRLNQFPQAQESGGTCTVGLLQANVPQELKWEDTAREFTFQTYERLGREAVNQGAKLLIWPETAAPVMFGSRDNGWKRPGEISTRLEVPMLVGAPSVRMIRNEMHYFNSAFLVDANSLRYRYDKVHLVPFGEYMPLSWLLPIGPGLAAREADYSPGDEMTVMRMNGCPPFSVLICYEAIFPGLSRWALNQGARLLINITNDGWFGATAAPYQHLQMARMRSVENRVWLVRCANTGISAIVDPSGRIVDQIPLNRQGILVQAVQSSKGIRTFYTRFGDVFAWVCIAITMGVGLLAWKKPVSVKGA